MISSTPSEKNPYCEVGIRHSYVATMSSFHPYSTEKTAALYGWSDFAFKGVKDNSFSMDFNPCENPAVSRQHGF